MIVTTKGNPVKKTVLQKVSTYRVHDVPSTNPRVAATTLLETSLVGKRGIIFILASLGVKTYSQAPKLMKHKLEPTNIRTINKLRQEN